MDGAGRQCGDGRGTSYMGRHGRATVREWVTRDGQFAGQPLTDPQVAGEAAVAGILGVIALGLLLTSQARWPAMCSTSAGWRPGTRTGGRPDHGGRHGHNAAVRGRRMSMRRISSAPQTMNGNGATAASGSGQGGGAEPGDSGWLNLPRNLRGQRRPPRRASSLDPATSSRRAASRLDRPPGVERRSRNSCASGSSGSGGRPAGRPRRDAPASGYFANAVTFQHSSGN